MLERLVRRFKKETPSPLDNARAVEIGLEIEECFKYFNEHSSKILGDQPVILIHGSRVTLRKVEQGKGYSIETNGVVRTVGVDNIPRKEQIEMIRRIHNITIPYAEHVKTKSKKS